MNNTHRTKWTENLIRQRILEVVSTLGLTHFPTHKEMEDFYGNQCLSNKISEKGTIYWAKNLNLPLKKSETVTGYLFEDYAIKDICDHTALNSIHTVPRFPYDLLTDGCVKVDVKISKGFINNCNARAYTFNIEKKEPTCDIYLLYCVNDNGIIEKTMLIPAHIVVGQTQIGVGKESKWDQYLDRWDYITKISEFYRNLN